MLHYRQETRKDIIQPRVGEQDVTVLVEVSDLSLGVIYFLGKWIRYMLTISDAHADNVSHLTLRDDRSHALYTPIIPK